MRLLPKFCEIGVKSVLNFHQFIISLKLEYIHFLFIAFYT